MACAAASQTVRNLMSFTRLGRLTVLLLSLSLAQPFAALAQTNAPAELPPVAQEAMERGIIAAQQQEYLLAIRLFQDARKIAPAAPILFFNLGLAESKIPGRELRAMIWFGAYLEASPGAANVAAVKEQIKVLDIKNQGSLARLIRGAEDAAKKADNPQQALGDVAGLWAISGDIETAFQTVDAIPDAFEKDNAREAIAIVQAEAGDIAGAQKTADSIQDVYFKDPALRAIAEAHAKAGDVVVARKTAESIQTESTRKRAETDIDSILFHLGHAQAEAGDIAGAQKTVDSIQAAVYKGSVQRKIVTAQIKAGDIAGARKMADSLQGVETYDKDGTQKEIAVAQAETGDLLGAQKTADSIQTAFYKDWAQESIARAQVKKNNFSTVVSSAATAAPPAPPSSLVNQWIVKNGELLNAAVFLDIGAHLKSLPSDNAFNMRYGLNLAAKKIAAARQVITQMLKQQAKK